MFEAYIHVPFCIRRCGYCDFNTYTAVDMGAGASRGNYANMVIREMSIVHDWQIAAMALTNRKRPPSFSAVALPRF